MNMRMQHSPPVFKGKVTLVVPTLNEIKGMQAIMPRINRELLHQIIIVDGGSTDGTVEYAREKGYEVYRQKERGIRLGLIENYHNIKGDIIITFSPDGNSVPEEIPALIEKMKRGYDMVIVSRYLGDARSFDDTFISRLGNWFFTKIINFLFGFHYTDAMVMFRAYKREVPERLGIIKRRPALYERFIGRYISWEPQLSVRSAKHRLKITEIPGDEPLRVEDEGKVLRSNRLLPPSRIYHFRSGFACLCMFFEELIRWNNKFTADKLE